MKIDAKRDNTAAMIIKNVNDNENVDDSVENMDIPKYVNKNASAANPNVLIEITLPILDSSEMLWYQ